MNEIQKLEHQIDSMLEVAINKDKTYETLQSAYAMSSLREVVVQLKESKINCDRIIKKIESALGMFKSY